MFETPDFDRRIIFHVDMDSFYASCELAKRPELKDLPFIVGADPKEGKGRGVVLAANYPARKFGVKSGMPIARAWELCPDARYVFPDHRLYWEVSRRLMEILKSFTEKVEPVSVDEAFLDFTDDVSISGVGEQDKNKVITAIATQIKKKIFEKEKISCSIGVSNSKITSKIATDMDKPDGLTICEPRDVVSFLGPLGVEKIPGIGKVTQRRLAESFNVKTIEELSKIPIESLISEFGKSGEWFHRVALGQDMSEVITRWDSISQSTETTFDEDESNYDIIRDTMKELALEVVKRVKEDGYQFRNVGIKIRFSGFETHTRSHSLSSQTDSLEIALKECNRLLEEFINSERSVRLIGVRLSQLEKKRDEVQSSLLDWSKT